MIFVILGTQDKPFERIIRAVESLVKEGKIKEEVVVQAGCTKYNSDCIKLLDYISMEEFERYIEKANIIITHAGTGSILSSIKHGKKTIGIARLKKYKEHVNDHQLQILDNFSQEGYILKLDNENELYNALEKAKTFKPKEYKANNKFFVENLKKTINELLAEQI